MTIISDEQFPDPVLINSMDCLSADRYLNSVPESVTITQVCQDANNPSLVIVSLTLIGAFLYTPVCYILSVDGDRSYATNNITAPIAIGHYRNNDMPISTECRTLNPEVVFDFGRIIPNFLSVSTIEFKIVMVGTASSTYNTAFISSNPYTIYSWNKGLLPSPINLRYNGQRLEVMFQYFGESDCSCNVQCLNYSGVGGQLKFCQNDIQTLSVTQTLSGDPYNLSIYLSDGIGNNSTIQVTTVINVNPKPPLVIRRYDPDRYEITISPYSVNNIEITEADYQILKYVGDNSNVTIWKDWSERSYGSFIDRDILPNTTYGYAVRFKGKYGDISNASAWQQVT